MESYFCGAAFRILRDDIDYLRTIIDED